MITVALLAFLALIIMFLAVAIMGDAAIDEQADRYFALRKRHEELLQLMVTLEADLGRIPTPREIWALESYLEQLEEFTAEPQEEQ